MYLLCMVSKILQYHYFTFDIPNHINAAVIVATASSNCLDLRLIDDGRIFAVAADPKTHGIPKRLSIYLFT